MNLFEKRRNLAARADIVFEARTNRMIGIIGVPLSVAGACISLFGLQHAGSRRYAVAFSLFFLYQAILLTLLAIRAWPVARLDPQRVPPGTTLDSRWTVVMWAGLPFFLLLIGSMR